MSGSRKVVESGYEAIGNLLHRYLTGLILALVVETGTERTTAVVQQLFRRQQEERFLPGLAKLGLGDEPDAVACAKYHYLSNHLGGVSVAFVPESEKKAWIRYLPPRWIFDGTAIAAIPTQVSRAMLLGWHANNGVLLGNPNLGFVCTSQTVDGMPGLEGYYIEEDQPLLPSDRLRFRYGETCPPIREQDLPVLDNKEWPVERLHKVLRNYSMDYIRNIIPVITQELGPLVAQGILYRTGRKIGMQYSVETRKILGLEEPIDILEALLVAQGDSVERVGSDLSQTTWGLMSGLETENTPEWMDGLMGLWEGVLLVVQPNLRLSLLERLDVGESRFLWRISEGAPPNKF
ncbi:MAG: hypothetical protein CNE88_01145 [Acidimicrobiales bacterium MED-G01]|nr:MAG: hypothetical protein CNE88_01145 [Acidimicrobiales bacterium MED-G01]